MVPSSADPLPYLTGLYQLVPAERLAFILDRTGRQSDRVRRLPAASVAWLVIAMSLWPDLSVPQVWRRLHPAAAGPEPAESAFPQARRRLGVAVLRRLFLAVARPMATHQTVGAFYRGWRLMGLDGTALDLPDTPANARVFGRRGAAAFPQAGLRALCELGTHAVCGLAVKPGRRDERAMAGPLVGLLGPGDLLVWDRGFFGYDLVRRVLSRGAHLLARVPAHVTLAPRERLADGSYLADLWSPAGRKPAGPPLRVRVIEYTHDDPHRPGRGDRHRLVTDLLAPADLPAAEAPVVYHQRWEEELAFDAIKTHLNGRPVALRSKTPAGVVQEIYGLVLAHYLVRRPMHDAAAAAAADPDRLSFTNSLRVLQTALPETPGRPPAAWYRDLVREARRQTLRPRRDRWYPRVIKRTTAKWPRKRPHHHHPPQPTKPFAKAVVILI
jgi:hypothetical protein